MAAAPRAQPLAAAAAGDRQPRRQPHEVDVPVRRLASQPGARQPAGRSARLRQSQASCAGPPNPAPSAPAATADAAIRRSDRRSPCRCTARPAPAHARVAHRRAPRAGDRDLLQPPRVRQGAAAARRSSAQAVAAPVADSARSASPQRRAIARALRSARASRSSRRCASAARCARCGPRCAAAPGQRSRSRGSTRVAQVIAIEASSTLRRILAPGEPARARPGLAAARAARRAAAAPAQPAPSGALPAWRRAPAGRAAQQLQQHGLELIVLMVGGAAAPRRAAAAPPEPRSARRAPAPPAMRRARAPRSPREHLRAPAAGAAEPAAMPRPGARIGVQAVIDVHGAQTQALRRSCAPARPAARWNPCRR